MLSVSCCIACIWAMSIHPQPVITKHSTAINPTGISLKGRSHLNVLDLKTATVQGTQPWPPKMMQWCNETFVFERYGWRVTSCQGVRGNHDGETEKWSPLDAKWVNSTFMPHNNTRLSADLPISCSEMSCCYDSHKTSSIGRDGTYVHYIWFYQRDI